MEGSQYDPAEALKVDVGGNFQSNTTAQQLMIEMNQYSGINALAIQNGDEDDELEEEENWEKNYPLAPFPKETLKST